MQLHAQQPGLGLGVLRHTEQAYMVNYHGNIQMRQSLVKFPDCKANLFNILIKCTSCEMKASMRQIVKACAGKCVNAGIHTNHHLKMPFDRL